MRLVNDNNNLSVQTVAAVIFTVLDDLIVKIFQHQQHLRVCNGRVAVGKQRLKVKHGKVFVRGDGRRTVPDVGISSAGRKLGNIIDQRLKHFADIFDIVALEILEDQIVKIVKDGVVLRTELCQVGFHRDAEIGV